MSIIASDFFLLIIELHVIA